MTDAASLSRCPICDGRYRGRLARCPFDGAPLEPQRDELVGVVLADRFTLTAVLGVGAIGTVYRARDEASEASVAVKVLHAELGRERAHRQRFMRESRAIMRVRHPSIVHVLATGESEDALCWFAMAAYDGETLAKALARGPMAVDSARGLILAMASALAVAHAGGVVHRDLKPSNVILVARSLALDPADETRPVLVDFGLASVQGEPGLTETGDLIGSPHTMSPEQIRGEPPCPAMDLYALGCLWFHALTGRPPFVGRTSAVLDAHLTEPAPSLGSLLGEVPRCDAALVDGLLSKEPAARTSAFAELVVAARADARFRG